MSPRKLCSCSKSEIETLAKAVKYVNDKNDKMSTIKIAQRHH